MQNSPEQPNQPAPVAELPAQASGNVAVAEREVVPSPVEQDRQDAAGQLGKKTVELVQLSNGAIDTKDNVEAARAAGQEVK